MAKQSGILKAESSATTCMYTTINKKKKIRDPTYLDKTVIRMMDRNVLKNQMEENK